MLDKKFNPKWGKHCHMGFNLNQNLPEPFRIQHDAGGTVAYYQHPQHAPAPTEWYTENYAPSNRNCKCHRTLAFDNPYNYNSYHTCYKNKKDVVENVMLHSGHDDTGSVDAPGSPTM